MRISILPRLTVTTPIVQETTWEHLAESCAKFLPARGASEKEAKASIPLWSPILWDGYKEKSKARFVSGLWVLDFDDQPWGVVGKFLEEVPADFIWHTTFKFRSTEDPTARVRVIVRLSRDMRPDEYSLFYHKAAHALGISKVIDLSCADLARGFYTPCQQDGVTGLAGHRTTGAALDVDAILRTSTPTPDEPEAPRGVELIPIPHDAFAQLAKRYAKGKGEKAVLGWYLQRIADGEPFAEPGQRDNVLFRISKVIASEYPHGDPHQIAKHFARSLERSGDDAPSVASVAEKIARAQRKHSAKEEEQAEALTERIRECFSGERTEPYTIEELAAFGDVGNRWILTDGRGAWFYVAGEYVESGFPTIDVAARTYLAPAISAGIELKKPTARGVVDKTSRDLLSDYGRIVKAVEYDLTALRNTFDEERSTLVLAAAKPRALEPRYHEPIARWLELFAGPSLTLLCDWIAVARRLDSAAPALLVFDEAGTGKGLLAAGLSRLWTIDGPTPIENAMSKHNEAILQCPLIFADEAIPKTHAGRPRTEELRALITAKVHTIDPKHRAPVKVRGALRIMCAVQKLSTIFDNADLSAADIRALADRFVVIRTTTAAREYLQNLGGEETTRAWVDGDQIAEMALWIEQNHTVTPGSRLAIRGNASDLVRHLRVETGVRWLILFWVYEWLRTPSRHVIRSNTPAIRLRKNRAADYRDPLPWQIEIHPSALIRAWSDYIPEHQRPPRLDTLTHHLHELSSAGGLGYRVLDTSALLDWCSAQEESDQHVREVLTRGPQAPETSPENRPN